MARYKNKRTAWKWDVWLCVSGELRKRRAKCHRKENERRVGRSYTKIWERGCNTKHGKGPEMCVNSWNFAKNRTPFWWSTRVSTSIFLKLTRKWVLLRIPFISLMPSSSSSLSQMRLLDVLLLCSRDVETRLDYPHSHNIAHRDLKLGNTLVSSQHYITVDGDWAKVYDECPTCQRTQVKKLEQENEKVAAIKHWLSRVLQVRVLSVRVLPLCVLAVRVLLVQSGPVQSSPRNTVCL